MKRYCETSTFLVKEVDRSFNMMLENIPFSKSIVAISGSSKHKHSGVRSKCSFLLANCLDLMVYISYLQG
jgi:hypothetical protein